VPWLSFTAPEMTVSNGYYPVYLFYREQNILILAYGISETSEYGETWSSNVTENKSKIADVILNPPRYGDSYVAKQYVPQIKDGKVFFYKENNEVSSDSIERDLKEIVDIYKKNVDIEVKNESSVVSTGLFYIEKQLEDFIISNWNETEFGKKYDLIYEEGTLISQQYRTDIGIIDILARDKKTNSYVVIELKKNQTSDDTVGQALRYMGWIEEKKNDPNVKGIIVAGQFDLKLHYAMKRAKDIEVFVYEVDFKLKAHQ
jgi:RecB family endonuclease NucS